MMRNIFTLLLSGLTLLLPALLYAQTGEIQGKVLDKDTGEGIPFANIVVEQNGAQKGGTTTDLNGKFSFQLSPGSYDLKTSYVGYKPVIKTGVIVSADRTTFVDLEMSSGITLDTIPEIVEYRKPLIEQDNTTQGGTKTGAEIDKMPLKGVSGIAATTAGVYQNKGGGLNIRGARDYGTDYYVDGIKVRGTPSIPSTAIEQMTMITGGVPAKYGDATGGIINITTRGPSSRLMGSGEVSTSQFLDPYGYNLINANVAGPILKKNRGTKDEKTVLGFFVAGEATFMKDPSPSATGMWKVKDDVLEDLKADPLTPAPSGSGLLRSAEFLTKDDLEKIDIKPNTESRNISGSAKLDYQLTDDINVKVGGSMNYSKRDAFIYTFSLMNYENNPEVEGKNWRIFGRLTQRFSSPEEEAGEEGEEAPNVLQNAYYSLQLDYSKNYSNVWDARLQDDIFNYGYVGSFERHSMPLYLAMEDDASGLFSNNVLITYDLDTLVSFEPGEANPVLANYTQNYYDKGSSLPARLDDIVLAGSIINSPGLSNVHSLFYNVGFPYTNYGYSDNGQFRLVANGSVDIVPPGSEDDRNKHNIEFGFEYEQRVDRSYDAYPNGLWGLMRQLTSTHLLELDFQNPMLVIEGDTMSYDEYVQSGNDNFSPNDTIFYERKYNAEDQSSFDKALREKLGLAADNKDYIQIDTISPDFLSLDMFSAEELLNNGYVFYRGYDYMGNKLTDQVSFNDFFTDTAANGDFTRPIGAFRPNYVAGYIQDKFTFRDLILRIGLRVSRYDANQKVLKDKYSLYAAKSAAELSEDDITRNYDSGELPSTIGEDFMVYVNDNQSSNPEILGYRSGDTWFNKEGTEIKRPDAIAAQTSTGKVQPYLEDPDVDIKNRDYDPNSSFEDYDPDIIFMPRVAFSFPISDEANFFAHYDVKAQRPRRNVITPYSYYFFERLATQGSVANPNLKPEKTISYELGFQQRLTLSSALKISGFYQEVKDMVQLENIVYAYPNSYITFANVDFGTVKGLTVQYDLRRTKNIKMEVNYTLQWASGTGSDETSQGNLVSLGEPNLRAIFPLDYDQRHTIVTSLDYRFMRDSKGPEVFGKHIFENSGVNLLFNIGSGTPFTMQPDPVAEAMFGIHKRRSVLGSVNGARLPWNFRTDARIDKSFMFKTKGDKPRQLGLNVYLRVLNLFNNKTVLSVYRYTGSPDDDGYLSSAEGQLSIEEKEQQYGTSEPFTDLYDIKVQDPNNFSLPRMIRLGAIFNF